MFHALKMIKNIVFFSTKEVGQSHKIIDGF